MTWEAFAQLSARQNEGERAEIQSNAPDMKSNASKSNSTRQKIWDALDSNSTRSAPFWRVVSEVA